MSQNLNDGRPLFKFHDDLADFGSFPVLKTPVTWTCIKKLLLSVLAALV
jgi:hypothetical protein